MKRLLLSMSTALVLASPVFAQNSDVLIIGNTEPGVLQRLTGSGDLADVQRAFEAGGAEVSFATGADAADMRAAFLLFSENLDATTDDVAIVLVGRFVSTVAGAYLLPVGSDTELSLGRVVTDGLPLDAVYAVAAGFPGRALLVLGEVEIDAPLAAGLSADLPLSGIPQGVTVAIGAAGDAARFADDLSDMTGDDVLSLAREAGLSLVGYVPRELALLSEGNEDLPQIVASPVQTDRTEADNAAWQRAVSADTETAYDTYLAAFPEGINAGEARQRLTAIRSEPFFREKQAEEALALSRDARREIQRDLSLLGYNTRGIDGIFGRGTRGAVTAWQNDNGMIASGYLSSDLVTRLDAQAERRAAEFEEEARQRQAELERQDRAFWEETGARGDEPGYRAYLKRFPDGQFAEVAEERLGAIEEQRRAQAEGQDRALWQQVREADSADAYRSYLSQRPDGAFVEEAKARIEWLSGNSELRAVQAQAQAEEAALGLNAAGRRLAESRLRDLGLEPGAVDGTFDEEARRAIRRYQDARNLRVSGFLDQATVVRLMADTILR